MISKWRLSAVVAMSSMAMLAILPSFCFSLNNLMQLYTHPLWPLRRLLQRTGNPISSIPGRYHRNVERFSSATSSSTSFSQFVGEEKKIAIWGGGLAGLSVALHLLEKTTARNSGPEQQQQHHLPLSVVVFDSTASAGLGGASAVAGGCVASNVFLLSYFLVVKSLMILLYLLLLIELGS